jgi:hypothetical protein
MAQNHHDAAMQTGRALRLAMVIGAGGLMAACAGTSRFDGLTSGSARTQAPASAPAYQSPPPVTSLPSAGSVATAPVESQPLPPPVYPGSQPQPATVPSLPGQTAGTDVPRIDPSQATQPPQIGSSAGTQVATLGGRQGAAPVTNRDGVIGGWTAREANGSTCRVTLSSSPALDLYRASASACANKELQKVTGWDYRDGEVYLYQPGGAVAARMRVNDRASLSGAVTRSGAGLTMSR